MVDPPKDAFMQMPQISPSWEPTRLALQKYAQALVASPRAAAEPSDRWTHVSMHPAAGGLSTVPITLGDGSDLVSTLDVANHQILIAAGSDSLSIALEPGPSPLSVGEAVASLAAKHGTDVTAEASRYEDATQQAYDPADAASWLENTKWTVDTFAAINASVAGEITGPHLWPHGFDVATEWFSPKTVDFNGSEASAQIAIGFYPAGDGYFYVNPWPFEESWADVDLPGRATWHVDGWQGAKLMASDLGSDTDRDVVVALAAAVHDLARVSLS
jgi:hypothetical protein